MFFFCFPVKADVLVDIECDAKHLDKVIRLLKCEVQSVNYTATQSGDNFPPPLSACSSFGMFLTVFGFDFAVR